jgi:tetratricopeptide (TPR) repeat protein
MPGRIASRSHTFATLVALALLTAGAFTTQAQQSMPEEGVVPAPAPGIVVTSPRLPEVAAALGPGIGFWLHRELSIAGVALQDTERFPAIPHGALKPREAWELVAQKASASHLLLTEAELELGQLRLRLALVERGGAVVAGAERDGAFAELGTLLRDATIAILDQIQLPVGELASDPGPSLSEIASFSRALEHLRLGEFTAAHKELPRRRSPAAEALRQRIARASSRKGVPLASRARLAIAQGDFDRSWLRLRRELRERDDPELLIAAGDAAAARGETPRAVAFYQRAARLDPDNPDAQLGEAAAQVELGNPAAARRAFERAAVLLPGDPRPLEALAGLPDTAPEESAQLLLRAGSLQAARFETDRASSSFDAAADLDPALSAPAKRGLGDVLQLVGQTQDAIAAYEQAVSLGAGEPATWTTLGALQRAQGDAASSQSSLTHALEGDPSHAPAHREMGQLLASTGRPDEAVAHLERALALAPGDGKSRRALAEALHARGEAGRALPLLRTGEGGGPVESEDLRVAARIRGESGDLEGARLALERAAELSPIDGSLQEALARVHEARGDSIAAEQALQTAAALSGDSPGAPAGQAAGQRSQSFTSLVSSFPARRFTGRSVTLLKLSVVQDWHERVLGLLRLRVVDLSRVELDLAKAIADQFELDPDPAVAPEVVRDLEQLRAFDTDRGRIALANDVLVTQGIFVARANEIEDEELGRRVAVELQLLAGTEPTNVVVYANKATLSPEPFLAWNYAALGLYGSLFLLSLLPLLRGWGTVRVTFDYGKVTGFFSIKISRRPEKAKQGKQKGGSQKSRFQRRLRSLGRFERYMADRDTVFRWIPARRYHVAVHGLLQQPGTEHVVGNYFEERSVRVQRGQEVSLHFDFVPKEAPISVQIYQNDELAPRAQVAIRGSTEPLKYAHDGEIVLPLGLGAHTLVVGCDGCVMQRRVEVSTLGPMTVALATNDPVSRVFADCPEAVDPYLLGDGLTAADALERAGQTEVAHQVRARHYQEAGDDERAAAHFQAAGQHEQAAQLGAFSADPERSASLYEQAGNFARAAESYEAAGDPKRAAEAYEASYEYDKAIEAYRSAGRTDKVVELLEKTGGFYEAGVLALEAQDLDRAVSNLQQVDLRDPDYAMACRMLADILDQREEHDLAAAKLRAAIDASGGQERADVQLLAKLGDLLDRSGDREGAIAAFEAVRQRDLAFPEAATRIQELRDAQRKAAEPATEAPRAPTKSPAGEMRYEILGELGRGGMGVVFKARDRRLGRIVALKQLPDNLRNHPTAVKLFLREARAAAALNHPNIVTLYDADQWEGNYFITMEYLDGFPLNTILKKRVRLGAKDAVRIGAQVATGLQFAHERRIVHRDIKTANLFFTRERTVKIMDFGLAKMMEEVRKAATIIGGTPYYMAPEQAVGEVVDERADLYALGVTLFELVTGSVPFTSGDLTYHHRNTPPPDPRSLAEVPDALAGLILALLAKLPEDRLAPAAEVVRRLQALAASL